MAIKLTIYSMNDHATHNFSEVNLRYLLSNSLIRRIAFGVSCQDLIITLLGTFTNRSYNHSVFVKSPLVQS